MLLICIRYGCSWGTRSPGLCLRTLAAPLEGELPANPAQHIHRCPALPPNRRYFLGYQKPEDVPEDPVERAKWMFGLPACLEL